MKSAVNAWAQVKKRVMGAMVEKAVDENTKLAPMNVFNAVTRQNHPSPRSLLPDGGSVGKARRIVPALRSSGKPRVARARRQGFFTSFRMTGSGYGLGLGARPGEQAKSAATGCMATRYSLPATRYSFLP